MIRVMTIGDYGALFTLWTSTPNMGLRSLDDSEEGIADAENLPLFRI